MDGLQRSRIRRSRILHAALQCAILCATATAAQRATPHLLTRDESLSIIGAALNTRTTPADCSHLVHAIYQAAGYPYPYAPSSDLYRGTAPFRRVNHPQPGDLAVWRGHAAIVVNPAQKTFFGSTTTGLRVESSNLDYWRHQGSPRYYRYLQPALLTHHERAALQRRTGP